MSGRKILSLVRLPIPPLGHSFTLQPIALNFKFFIQEVCIFEILIDFFLFIVYPVFKLTLTLNQNLR